MKWMHVTAQICSLAAAAAAVAAAAAAQHRWPSKEAVLLDRHPLSNAAQLLKVYVCHCNASRQGVL